MSSSSAEGRRAPVRPRVRSPYSNEVVLLEDEVEDLLQEGHRGVLFLYGPPDWGKRAALGHMRHLLGVTRALEVREEEGLERDTEPEGQLILFATRRSKSWFPSDWVGFQMAPWGMDEALEYLEVRHSEEMTSVMRRLVAHDDAAHLEGEPLLWRAVLDAMAADADLETLRAALAKCVEAEAGRVPDRWSLALWCLDRVGALGGDPPVGRFVPEGLVGESLLVRSDRARLDWLVRELLDSLRRGDTHMLSKIVRPVEALISELGPPIADEAGLRELVSETLWAPLPVNAAVLASLLHVHDPAWIQQAPASMREPLVLDLRDARLPGLSAQQIDLREVPLDRVKLAGADLMGADLTGASLGGADLAQADLAGARLDRVWAPQVDLHEACLAQATMNDANLVAADLRGASLHGARLDRAALDLADLRGIRGEGASFQGTEFGGARLEGADLRRACLDGANLREADLREARCRGASMRSTALARARLDGVDLEDATLPGAVLVDANLTATCLAAALLRGAVLTRARMAFVDLEGADLRDAWLNAVEFHLGSSRSGMVFSPLACEGSRTGFYTDDDQHLDSKPIEEIRKANFRRADLRGAHVHDTDWYLVDLRDAQYDPQQGEYFRRCRAFL